VKKPENCKTCKHRNPSGTYCNKNKEPITMMDWCGNYKRKKKEGIV